MANTLLPAGFTAKRAADEPGTAAIVCMVIDGHLVQLTEVHARIARRTCIACCAARLVQPHASPATLPALPAIGALQCLTRRTTPTPATFPSSRPS